MGLLETAHRGGEVKRRSWESCRNSEDDIFDGGVPYAASRVSLWTMAVEFSGRKPPFLAYLQEINMYQIDGFIQGQVVSS